MSAELSDRQQEEHRARWEAICAAAARLPNTDCDGCTKCASRCAGEVPMAQPEYQQIVAHLAGRPAPSPPARGPEEMAAPCRFLERASGLCRVYDVRPLACRLFGLTPWWPCPAGRFAPKLDGARELLEAYCELPRASFGQWCRCLGDAPIPDGRCD
jgi:Fe-S-cluster containining protein